MSLPPNKRIICECMHLNEAWKYGSNKGKAVAFHNLSCSPGNVKTYLPSEKCQSLTLYVMNNERALAICESTAMSP